MRRRVDGRQDDGGGGGRAGARVRARDLDQRLVVGVGVEEVATRARVWGAEVWVRRVGEFGEGGGREEGIHGGDGGGMRGGPLRHLGDFWGRERKKNEEFSASSNFTPISGRHPRGLSLFSATERRGGLHHPRFTACGTRQMGCCGPGMSVG